MNRKNVLALILTIVVITTTALCRTPSTKAVMGVGGHIASDTTWTSENTYQVTNDTYGDRNATLTMLPGVNVEFDDTISLVVQGSLIATGARAARCYTFPFFQHCLEVLHFSKLLQKVRQKNYCDRLLSSLETPRL